ncbi:hypothetical protein BDZ91DRAFT_714026 [Kalaharituber pfeilii]|nr:hypothetical protein BDZ91DRAFT_714026 [Kalaharituber pfeilii]
MVEQLEIEKELEVSKWMRREVEKVGIEMSDLIRHLADKLNTTAGGTGSGSTSSTPEERIEKVERQLDEQKKDIHAILETLQANFSPQSSPPTVAATSVTDGPPYLLRFPSAKKSSSPLITTSPISPRNQVVTFLSIASNFLSDLSVAVSIFFSNPSSRIFNPSNCFFKNSYRNLVIEMSL